MKPTISFRFSPLACMLLLSASPMLSVSAAPPAADVPQAAATRSIFIMPANPKQGRDPFFPESPRPYEAQIVAGRAVEITALRLVGVSGPPNHRLFIINNRTFAVGDEQDVRTPGGVIHVRCVEAKAHSVVIQAGNQQVELNFSE